MSRLITVVFLVLFLCFPVFAADQAPTGIDNETNGFVKQNKHDKDRAVFDETEVIEDGLGPLYNAQSCRECHQNPVSGSSSQVLELRCGHNNELGMFENPMIPINNGEEIISGRSLVNLRAICPSEIDQEIQLQERVPKSEKIVTFRISLNLLGDGFVEAVADETLVKLAKKQCKHSNGVICGQVLYVPVLEAPGVMEVGRFGWKNQQRSLLSFSADAYLNEMGITNKLMPNDITNLCDTVADPEDSKDDIETFARFIRATKAPSRDAALAASAEAISGEQIFAAIGCNQCHVEELKTAPAGTLINGGEFEIPPELGDKMFHPYSDFLLHDIGTGDGIVMEWTEHYPPEAQVMFDQEAYLAQQETQYKMRTAPLWGLRLRPTLMHDGQSLTINNAIKRHGGEAASVTDQFKSLNKSDTNDLIAFLLSL